MIDDLNYLVSSYLGDSPGDSPGGLLYPGDSSGDSRGHYTALDSPGDSPGYLPRPAYLVSNMVIHSVHKAIHRVDHQALELLSESPCTYPRCFK